MTNEETEELIAKLVCEELTDEDVSRLKGIAASDPDAFKCIVEQVAFSDLVAQSVAPERSEECFTEMVKASLSVLEGPEDEKFVNSVKSKIKLDNSSKSRRLPKSRRTIRPNRRSKKKSPVLAFLAFAAILAFSTAAILYIVNYKGSGISTNVELTAGEIMVDEVRYKAGQKIPGGKMIRVFSSEAEFVMDDGTNVKVRGGSLIKYDPGEKRKFLLTNGRLFASVKKQRRDPLFFETPFSMAEILGTEFSLSINGDRDQLDVKEGKIRFKSLITNEELIVETGQKSHVTRQGKIEYRKVPKLVGEITHLYLLKQDGKVIRELDLEDTISLNKYGKKLKLAALHTSKIQVVLFVRNGAMIDEKQISAFKSKGKIGKAIDLPGKAGEYTIRLIPYDKFGNLKSANQLKLKIVN